ncbi:2Fe-2S iron-sulfur cluster-binding protein [Neobacillus niacini]|uniref:2Fe-2S iron-sulfur cluster-binding protein n=1 Tax=Neobacillus niacini TaxID=86668 RepID=UPI002FFEE961
MEKITLKIKRKVEGKSWIENYFVDIDTGKSTLLEALQKVREKVDPSLAIRYGCRFKNCGLCGVTVNEVPRMACMTKVKNNMNVGPLNNMPILQDLVVDRSFITETIKEKKLIPLPINTSTLSVMNEKFEAVSKCTDCQACISGSTVYKHDKREEVVAPLFFVKLAQLQFHPQNTQDYSEKANELGVKKYKDSPPIPCPYGIPIKKLAIDSFLENDLKV